MVQTRKRAREAGKQPCTEVESVKPQQNECSKGEDLISQLPDNCLVGIFERLKHKDLDEIAALSSRMNRLSNVSRPKIGKIKALKFIITPDREIPGELVFTIKYANQTQFLLETAHSSDGLFKKKRHEEFPKSKNKNGKQARVAAQSQQQAASIIERVVELVKWFDFQQCHILSITVDDNFLPLLGIVSSSTQFNLKGCTMNLSHDGQKRFVSELLAQRPPVIDLGFDQPNSFVDQDFVNQYTLAVPSPDLTVITELHQSPMIRCDKPLAEVLCNFTVLSITHFLVNTDWILFPLMERLRLETDGFWKFRISRDFDHSEIFAAVSADLKYTFRPGRDRQIEILGTNRVVRFFTRPDWMKEENIFTFTASFQDRSCTTNYSRLSRP
ncbi:hypothetical protein PENTCL1PPCAC_23938 [Pristionchus entomophagus]|uniref:F-box domain-containing protein n=1 Tax=Pristionchus entomophagus TaxID=358040 RepID=A0AAV5U6M5_9BILA|nr:hypothetical protein PENTCL1PPCAC_23938 [Pristionchus entomophagus]